IRVVTLRSGVVLSHRGGILGRLLPLFRLGLGGRIGSGRQVMSWIALSEWAAVARFLMGRADISGPVNLTTPSPVSNAEFTSALAAAVHRPAVMIVPVPALKLAVGGVSSDILSSARVLPRRPVDAGYQFRHPGLARALAAELSGGSPVPAPACPTAGLPRRRLDPPPAALTACVRRSPARSPTPRCVSCLPAGRR